MSSELLHRRAEMIATLFLQDLKPEMLLHATPPNRFGDYFAGFRTKNRRHVTIMIEIKATENPVTGPFRFYGSANSNIPVLIMVVDVKANEIYFNWLSKAKTVSGSHPSGRTTSTLSVPLRKATETTKKELLAEIEAK